MTSDVVRPKRAIAYFRCSPEGGDKSNGAVPEQERAFLTFCGKAGYEPGRTFADSDSVAPGTSRTYAAMLDHVEQNKGVAVVVPDITVFGENEQDVAIALLELESLGAYVHMLGGQVVDPMRVVMRSALAGRTVGDIGERIKSAMLTRAVRGEGLGKPPYGYKIGANKKLEVLPTEAETVKLIYSLYTQKNRGIRLIVRHLNEHGIPTRKGRNWSMVTIRDILRNRAYVGTYTRFGMRVPGSHPPIITPDMFRWAQSRLDQRKPKRKNGQAEPFLLSGLIYCGYCGNRMVGVTRKQAWTRRKDGSRAERQYRYYQCQSRTNQSVCQYHTRRAGDLENEVVEYLKSQRDRLASAQRKPATSAADEERKRVETARKNADRRLRQALQQVATGAMAQQRFRTLSTQLVRSRRELTARLMALDAAAGRNGGTLLGQPAAEVVDRLSNAWQTMDLRPRRLLLEGLIDRVNVFDDRVEVDLRVG